MESEPTSPGGPEVRLPVMVAAEVQDSLLVVMHDLHRLEGLISHATDNLLERFGVANQNLTESNVGDSPELQAAREALRSAVTELQFQDMASQLIWHTTKCCSLVLFDWPQNPWARRMERKRRPLWKWRRIDPIQ